MHWLMSPHSLKSVMKPQTHHGPSGSWTLMKFSKSAANHESAVQSILKSLCTGFDVNSIKATTKNVIRLFYSNKDVLFTLDVIKNSLQIDTRRIYDIINVLTALKLIKKVTKGHYKWNSIEKALTHISEIQGKRVIGKENPSSLSFLCNCFIAFCLPGVKLSAEKIKELFIQESIESSCIKTKKIVNVLKIFLAIGLAECLSSKSLTVSMLGPEHVSKALNVVCASEIPIGKGNVSREAPRNAKPQSVASKIAAIKAEQVSMARDVQFIPKRRSSNENLKLMEKYISSGSIILPKVRIPQTSNFRC